MINKKTTYMEVSLKKTKITNSILKQSLRSSEHNLKNGEILGWCVYDKTRYIICYQSSTQTLTKYLMFKDISFEAKHKNNIENVSYDIKVSFEGNYIPIHYTAKDEIERDDFIKTFQEAKHKAQIKGQFFI